jgi:predicted transcriptional regulator
VHQVHEALEGERKVGYTTVLKLLQIMAGKSLVERVRKGRLHIYSAALPEAETQEQMIGDLVDRAFEGSASKLVLRALHERPTTPEELQEIRELVERMTEEDEEASR